MLYYVAIIAMTFMGATASLFLKKASGSKNLMALISNLNLYIGGSIYVLSALINIWVLRHLEYSVVLPLTSFTYIWTMLLSYRILKEKINKKKITGVACIILGAILVAF